MKRKIVSGTMVTLLLIGMLTLAFNIQPVRASGTIYIRPDGFVEGTDKIQRDGDVYTFTDNIYDEIVVQIDNIVVDGAGHTLQGTGSGHGISVTGRSNVTIKKMEIKAFDFGIFLFSADNNRIIGNTITANNWCGIGLDDSSNYNTISGNNLTNNGGAAWTSGSIRIQDSSNNTVSGNNITNNLWNGIRLYSSSNNSVYGNTITANNWNGIWFDDSSNYNIVSGNNITNNWSGIRASGGPFFNTISGNNITNNYDGVRLVGSHCNTISENNIAENNRYGIQLDGSSRNIVSGNNITASSEVGIWLGLFSSRSKFYHNNFVENTQHVYDASLEWPGMPPSINMWDNGYPSGGNYWSDFTGVDKKSGPNQDTHGSDGIFDKPYVISEHNLDNYPLVEPWGWPKPPALEALEELIETVETLNLPEGTESSLTSKLEEALHLFDKGNENGATHKLMDFINHVEALQGKKLLDDQADYLISEAQRIIDIIESFTP